MMKMTMGHRLTALPTHRAKKQMVRRAARSQIKRARAQKPTAKRQQYAGGEPR